MEPAASAAGAGSQQRGPPGEAAHSGLQRRGEETGGHASEKQSTQRARVFGREVANCALIIVQEGRRGLCSHGGGQPAPRRAALCWASPSSLGWLAAFFPFFHP